MRSNGVERVAGRKSSLLVAAAVLGLAWMVGCGDGDDSEPNSNDDGGSAGDSSGGKGGTSASGGKGGTSGSGATGGDGSGATGGSDGSGATGGDPTSGSGGSGAEPGDAGGAGGNDGDPDPVGGNGGEGGDDGVPNYHVKKLNGPNGTLVPGVHDLRGLTFSASGKIYASGFVGYSTAYPNASDRQIAIVRFNADGTLDSSWDGDGIRTLNLRTRQGLDDAISNDGDEYSIGLLELSNTQIVVSVNVRDGSGKGRDVALLKFTQFGGQVNFGSAAVKKVNFGWADADNASFLGTTGQPVDESWGIALDKSGATEKIVVFGYGPARRLTQAELDNGAVQRYDNDRYVVRVNADDGNVDATFNGGKPFTFHTTGTSSDGGRRGIVLDDGTIVSAGYTNLTYNGGNTVVILGLKPDGTPDPQFTYGIPADGAESIPGVYFGNPFKVDGGITECYGITRQSTGRFVTTGYGRATAADGVSTLGYLTTVGVDMVSIAFKTAEAGGAPDTTFGSSSTFAVQSEGLGNVSSEDRGRDVIALPDDRLVYAGRLGDFPAIFVSTPDGELDPAAGGIGAGPNGTDTIDGAYTYPALSPVAGAPNFYQVALSPDGKRIAATTSNHPDGAILAIIDVE